MKTFNNILNNETKQFNEQHQPIFMQNKQEPFSTPLGERDS